MSSAARTPVEALTPGGTKIRAAASTRRLRAAMGPIRQLFDRVLSRLARGSSELKALQEENDALEAQLDEALNLYKEAKVEIGFLQKDLKRREQELEVRRPL